jgi:hypothetical protein
MLLQWRGGPLLIEAELALQSLAFAGERLAAASGRVD